MITIEELQNIVREASKLMLVDTFDITEKGDIANIVTSSDVAVQDFLCQRLVEALPGSGFLCEEEDMWDTSQEYTWIIDPIDGTANYSRGIDQCAICVGLRCVHENDDDDVDGKLKCNAAKAGEMLMSCVYLPRTDEMFCAEKGKGATRNGQPIHVSDRPFENSIMCTALAVYHKEYADECSRIIVECFKQCNDIRRFGAAAPELCYLAMGRVELYFEYLLSPWDFAAASLILTEAGGVLCDLEGNQLTCTEPRGVLAANNKENLQCLLAIVRG